MVCNENENGRLQTESMQGIDDGMQDPASENQSHSRNEQQIF